MELHVLLVLILLGAFALSLAWNALLVTWRGIQRTLAVRRIAGRLGDPTIARGRQAGWVGTFVTGRFEGRTARVALAHLRGDYLRCAIRLEHALDGLVIYPTQGSSELLLARQRQTGRLTALGEEHLDAKFAVQGVAPQDAARLFGGGQVEPALDRLFGPLRTMRVTIEDGWLIATRRLRRGETAVANDSVQILQTLSLVAPFFCRRELRLQLQGRSFACTDSAGVVCPYCRDTLSVSGGDPIARCESCRTVHHEACFAEAGGCTVLGCAAQARRRRGVRV